MAEDSQVDVKFFIDELARMDQANVRRFESMSNRLALLERKIKPHSSDDDLARSFAIAAVVMVGLELLPILIDMVRKWKSSESLPSSSSSV